MSENRPVRKIREPRRALRRWVVALLCLATWRGPIPWVHEHSLTGAMGRELEHHVHLFHHLAGASESVQWHFHWLLPWNNFKCPDEPDQSPAPADPLSSGGAIADAQNSAGTMQFSIAEQWNPLGDVAVTNLAAGDLIVPRSQYRPLESASFAVSLLSTAPLCAVFGVALC